MTSISGYPMLQFYNLLRPECKMSCLYTVYSKQYAVYSKNHIWKPSFALSGVDLRTHNSKSGLLEGYPWVNRSGTEDSLLRSGLSLLVVLKAGFYCISSMTISELEFMQTVHMMCSYRKGTDGIIWQVKIQVIAGLS